MSAVDKLRADIEWWERQEWSAQLTLAIAQKILPVLRSALKPPKGETREMPNVHNPSDSATDTMHHYETNTDQGDNATPSADPEPEPVPATDPVPATEPLPDTNKGDSDPIPMSDRQSPWQSENEGAETKQDTEATDGTESKDATEAKEGGPEVRTV